MQKLYFILIFIVFIQIKGLSQNNNSVTVEYKNGSFAREVPYGVSFKIIGTPVHPKTGEPVEKIVLIISPENSKKIKNDTVRWTKEDGDDHFALDISKELYPGTKYKFTFGFYVERNIDPVAFYTILNKIKTKAVNLFIEQGGTTKRELNERIVDAENEVSKEYPNFRYLENGKDQQGIRILFPDAWVEDILEIAQKESIKKNILNDLNETYDLLKETIEEILKQGNAELDVETKECLEIILKSDFSDFLENSKNLIPCIDGIDDNDLNSLVEDIRSKTSDIIKIDADINKKKDESDSLEASLRRQNLLYLDSYPVYPESVDINTDESSLERLGLKYGVGWSPIGFDDNAILQYMLLRFYIIPVDKNMAKPYISFWSLRRLSLNIGSVVGNLKYKDQPASNLDGLDIKLLTGLSYDLSEQISMTSGFLWFNYEEGNPFNKRPKTKASIFIGLSFDLNVIENIRK